MAFRASFPLILLLALCPALPLAQPARAAEPAEAAPVVVTATRLATPVDQVGSTVNVITRKEIERRNAKDVAELLQDVPGLHVTRTGTGAAQLSIRGGKNEHVLVLLDGVEMNDAISIGRSFDFSEMTLENIERIEVVSGPQSTLYGSSAMSGVVNIITRTGRGPARGSVHVAGGYPGSALTSAEASGGNEWVGWSVAAGGQTAWGLSSAAKHYGNTEKDRQTKGAFAGKINFTPSEEFDVDFTVRYTHIKLDLDNAGGPGGDDPNHTGSLDRLFLRTGATLRLFEDLWEQKLVLSLTDLQRKDRNDPDEVQPFDWMRSTFDSRLMKADWQHNLNWPDNNTFTVGVSAEEEMGKNRSDSGSAWGDFSSDTGRLTSSSTSVYVQDQLRLWDALTLTAGLRVDDVDTYGTKTTGRLAAAYAIEPTDTILRASWGSGFKAPSLYQRFSDYGNRDLSPETNTGWDAGVTQYFVDKTVRLDATVYENLYKNLIDYNYATQSYYNVGRVRTRGVELKARWQATETVALRGGAAFNRTKDLDTNKPLPRRPETVFSVGADWKVHPDVTLSADYRHVGRRADLAFLDFTSSNVQLSAYDLVSVSAAWQVREDLEWYVRLDNLLNERYEDVWGYETPGFGVTTGIKWRF